MLFTRARDIQTALQNNETTCDTILKTYFNHIDKFNPQTNSIVIDMRSRAYQKAQERDAQRSRNETLGPLHGVPISIKEAFNIEGFKTTVNFPPLKNNVATDTSILVKRLEEAGAIVVGKTNVPLMLSDSQTFGPLYPTCNNPYDLTRTPGGSTGGGASAVASGMSCFEIGSDIGGSIRNPAHYCGLFGLKPTQNGHVHDGHVPPLPGKNVGFGMMNCTGPLARTVDDLKLAYDIAYQPDWTYNQYLPVNDKTNTHQDLSQYRIAWYDHIGTSKATDDTRSVLTNMATKLRHQGATVEKIELNERWSKEIYDIWATLFGLMVGQDVGWGVRQLLKLKFKSDAKGSSLNVYSSLKKGLNLDFKAYSEALLRLKELTAIYNRYFDQYDFILGPTSAGEAFPHNPKHKPMALDGKPIHYTDYTFPFVMPYNAMGNPVLVIPGQQDETKLPIGVQVIGRHHAEQALLHFGGLMEECGFKFRKPALVQSP